MDSTEGDERDWANELGGIVEGVEVEFPGHIHPANARLLDALGVTWTVAEPRREQTWTQEDDMEADWFDAETNGTAILEQKRSDAIMSLRGAPSFSLTILRADESNEHFAGATDTKPGSAHAFVALAAYKAVQDMVACTGRSFEDCLDILRLADERGV